MTYIQNLRHGSLHLNVFYMHVTFYDWKIINDGDILVQKKKSEKLIFQFPGSLISLHVYQFLYE